MSEAYFWLKFGIDILQVNACSRSSVLCISIGFIIVKGILSGFIHANNLRHASHCASHV
jgi:hypothetical protein